MHCTLFAGIAAHPLNSPFPAYRKTNKQISSVYFMERGQKSNMLSR